MGVGVGAGIGVVSIEVTIMLTPFSIAGAGTELGKKWADNNNKYLETLLVKGQNDHPNDI